MSKYYYQHGKKELYVIDDNVATDLVLNKNQWTELDRSYLKNFETIVEIYYDTSLFLCSDELENPLYQNNVVRLGDYRKERDKDKDEFYNPT